MLQSKDLVMENNYKKECKLKDLELRFKKQCISKGKDILI